MRPLFIGGCPRSGTTLLRAMLDQHPDLGMPHESNFVRPLWWQRRQFGDLRSRENRERLGEWIFSGPDRKGYRLRDKEISKADAVARVADAPPTIGSVIAACFGLYAEVNGKTRWGDKRPSYYAFLPQLFELFPDAQYVNVVRDPRGSVASQALMPWNTPEEAVPAAIVRWESAARHTDAFARAARPDQLLTVRYEDLTRDPPAELARVCAFAALDPGGIDAMLEDRDQVKGEAHATVAEPVTTAYVERWRERLTPAQVRLVEEAGGVDLEEFGYEPSGETAAVDPREARELARQRRLDARRARSRRVNDTWQRLRYRAPVAAE